MIIEIMLGLSIGLFTYVSVVGGITLSLFLE